MRVSVKGWFSVRQAVLEAMSKHSCHCALRATLPCDIRSIDFLGHVVSADGIATDKRKIKALQEWPVPKSVSDVRSFLGLANYYRRFVEKFAHRAAPLTSLMGKGEFTWTDECEKAFRDLIQALTDAPVIVPPDPNLPFHVRTDASRFAVGAMLSQARGTIAFESRKLSAAERNYPVHEQELLAVVHALKTWKHLLQGASSKFRITTDNTPTKHVLTVKELTPRQARWAEFLAEFDFDIDYQPGETNVVADALSRRPDLALNVVSHVSAPDAFHQLVRELGKHDQEYQSAFVSASDAGSAFTVDDGVLYIPCLA